jgi:release factor glutamine methyltransferase
LALGEPLGYLIGHTPFLSCTIWLDSKPLIPRPETEYWTEKAILEINTADTMPTPITVLDLCAGSGCIGVAVAVHSPHTQVHFTEIDERHLPTIEKNVLQNAIPRERTTLFHANLFGESGTRYDFILSNPPYIDMDLNRTDESVLQHEPYIALSGGLAGLEIIKTIIETAPQHLKPQGQLWLEHEPEQSNAISVLGTEAGFTVSTHPDQYGVLRYSILVLQ